MDGGVREGKGARQPAVFVPGRDAMLEEELEGSAPATAGTRAYGWLGGEGH